ncbi:cytosine methyltransferase [Rathayibacter sp. AY1B1]|uniref:DNA cytosine methyltransferase n=1 Tax=unclassified Rathayibacter TaxID=2609250 RepID=UPI000CE800DC|nr:MULTISPECIES: DNA cytosine methyltransferase [unclassified Rathayibacter]PPI20183.1 cytosine methyltransferase [Rathayibacter sp. AY1B6]PPI31113.1 cytosine methyltransferase [Rathayibacter sp. AY1B1]
MRTAISLFSGCGGLDLGFKKAGFDILLGVDTDPFAAASHSINFPGSKFFQGSIADFTRETAEALVGKNALKEVDLLIGGPPCPPFSKSRFYLKDKPRAMNDPVGEVTISGYLNTLKWLKPKAFVLENVAGMAFKVHKETLDHILAFAKQLGYKTSTRVLNAADFGVPQIRQRFFIVGTLVSDFVWPEATHRDPSADSIADLPDWLTAGDAISDLDTVENADDKGHVAGGKHRDLLHQIPPGDNYLFLTAKRGHPDPQFEWRSRYWSFLLKLSPDMPAWTIQARRSNNMGPLHWKNRILRIEEVMRLQTFPDDWYLHGRVEQQWRQVGNAVPPKLAQALGEAVAAAMEEGEDVAERAHYARPFKEH